MQGTAHIRRRYATYWPWFHVTHRKYLRSIRQHGLLPILDRRGKGRVWLAGPAKLGWALQHVRSSHGWNLEDLVVLHVYMRRDELTMYRSGVFYVKYPINLLRISLYWRVCEPPF